MSADEELALELRNEWLANDPLASWAGSNDPLWLALARHVLRRERAAVRRATKHRKAIEDHLARSLMIERKCICRMCAKHYHVLARVVAVPRKGGRK